eukprot:gene6036-2647_t
MNTGRTAFSKRKAAHSMPQLMSAGVARFRLEGGVEGMPPSGLDLGGLPPSGLDLEGLPPSGLDLEGLPPSGLAPSNLRSAVTSDVMKYSPACRIGFGADTRGRLTAHESKY